MPVFAFSFIYFLYVSSKSISFMDFSYLFTSYQNKLLCFQWLFGFIVFLFHFLLLMCCCYCCFGLVLVGFPFNISNYVKPFGGSGWHKADLANLKYDFVVIFFFCWEIIYFYWIIIFIVLNSFFLNKSSNLFVFGLTSPFSFRMFRVLVPLCLLNWVLGFY